MTCRVPAVPPFSKRGLLIIYLVTSQRRRLLVGVLRAVASGPVRGGRPGAVHVRWGADRPPARAAGAPGCEVAGRRGSCVFV